MSKNKNNADENGIPVAAKKQRRKLPKLVKILIALLIVAAVVVAGLIIARKVITSKQTANTVYRVTTETYENVIEISGVVAAAQSQTLQAQSSGTVTAVYVKQGDSVKAGDVIIQMDDTAEKYNLAKHDYETQTVKITGSYREYQLKLTQRESLVQKINERKVTATFDGIIANINVAVGDFLESKDNVGTLVDKSYLTAEVEIAETDVGKLKEGQTVEFDFSASDKPVTGYVVGWPAIGTVTNRGATVVKATVRIDEYPDEILPNFSFSGKIKISPDENYVLVSRYAIGREDGQAFVVLADTGEKVNVVVSPYDTEYVKVESGLSGGEMVKAQSAASASGSQRRMGGMPGGMSGGSRSGGSSSRDGGMPSGGGFGGPPGF
ncbi:MAG: HlyD family efflux transporter periplasmic adaptor subunit [Treponema sp.]|nr:HlyD family efflux transporter periplasmic adaptor subunit [Treponema sp.]